MARHRTIVTLLISIATLLFLSVSCGGGGGGGGDKGAVVLFIADNISNYKQVVMTLKSVRLMNSGTQDECAVSSTPMSLDISNLALDTQLVTVGVCPALEYDRIKVAFEKDVRLMDNQGDAAQCSFTSYLDESNQTHDLQCDPVTGVCTFSMRNAGHKGREVVQVVPDQRSNLALDFDLQQFTVTGFGSPTCAVTMKVIPLDAEAMNKSNKAQSVTGKISRLDTAAQTVTLTRGGRSFPVDYSGVLPSQQPNLDILLQTALTEGFPVKVMSAIVDPAADAISASRIYPIAEGTVVNLTGNPKRTFTLNTPSSSSFVISYKQNSVDGDLADGAWVSLKLDGYDGADYLAAHVEVLPYGSAIED